MPYLPDEPPVACNLYVTCGGAEVDGPREARSQWEICLVIDPNNVDVCLKEHWVPFHVSDDTVQEVLASFGTAQEIARDTWKAEGLQGVQSTTRLVRLTLKKGTTRDFLSHQVRLFSGNALVVVPGRAPLCLRCKGTGHV